MAETKQNRLTSEEVLALRGLRLPAAALKALHRSGIYCEPAVSIEHQQLARRYVIRGVESGGAVAPIGAYCGFVDTTGVPLIALQRVDTVGVNGLHAVVLAPDLVRLQMFRIETTYELLITRHTLAAVEGKQRPSLQNSILFHGRQGILEMKLWAEDKQLQGLVAPVFYGRSGDQAEVPARFHDAILRLTAGVCCIGCRHTHLLQLNDLNDLNPKHAL
jgi:hypothetical protein